MFFNVLTNEELVSFAEIIDISQFENSADRNKIHSYSCLGLYYCGTKLQQLEFRIHKLESRCLSRKMERTVNTNIIFIGSNSSNEAQIQINKQAKL